MTTGLALYGEEVGSTSANGYIVDADSPPTVNIESASAAEGMDSTAVFLVTLSSPCSAGPNVYYATRDGSATCEGTPTLAADYSAASGDLYFGQEPYQWIYVSIANDTHSEPAAEEFYVDLSVSYGGAPATPTATGTGTIYDNDGEPLVTIDPASCREDAGQMTFTLRLGNASQSPAEVTWETTDMDSSPGIGLAAPGDDYTPTSSSTAVFQPGETETTVTVPILDDGFCEADEGFAIRTTGTSGCAVDPNGASSSGQLTAVGIIEDDDPAVVNSTGDDGDCDLNDGIPWTGALNFEGDPEVTLRAAIQQLNVFGSTLDTIEFDIPASYAIEGVYVIGPLSPLPEIQQSVTIAGDTQPGYGGQPIVVLYGANAWAAADGLRVTADACTIRALTINRFQGNAISLTSDFNTIVGCYLGTDSSGCVAQGNGRGILIDNGSENTIGGSSAADANLISGNAGAGIVIRGSGAAGNRVRGNLIGTQLGGMAACANGASGIAILDSAHGNSVGTNSDGNHDGSEGNTISGNTSHGVHLGGSATQFNIVAGNKIGIDPYGTGAVANGGSGVYIEAGACGNRIGSDGDGTRDDVEGNTIAYNGANGVTIVSTGAVGNSIRRNSIYWNAKMGIDLGDDGMDRNDALDADSGPNGKQNCPFITSIVRGEGDTRISGVLKSAANSSYCVEIFSNDSADTLAYEHGRTFLGYTVVTTDANGDATFSIPVPGSPTHLTTTATDVDGNTSEFGFGLTLFGRHHSGVADANANGININDIDQEGLGDCWFLSAVGATAFRDPTFLHDLFQDNWDGTVTIDFYPVFGQAVQTVTVSMADAFKYIPEQVAITGDIDDYGNVEVWPQMIELAYASSNCPRAASPDDEDYGARDMENGWAYRVWEQLYNPTAHAQKVPVAEATLELLTGWLNDGKQVAISVRKDDNGNDWTLPDQTILHGNHVDTVVGLNANGSLRIYDPHGEPLDIPAAMIFQAVRNFYYK